MDFLRDKKKETICVSGQKRSGWRETDPLFLSFAFSEEVPHHFHAFGPSFPLVLRRNAGTEHDACCLMLEKHNLNLLFSHLRLYKVVNDDA